MSVELGQVIDGKYRIVQLLGKGGMGSVYAGEHLIIGRRVAVKVLHSGVGSDAEAVARFEREAQAAGRIGNDHILEILDFGSLPDGSRYMVCEYLDGETLASRIQREQRIQPPALVTIARQLLNGLDSAHAAGVVHRDLKPENVFLLRHKAGWADFVKIIDFGVSKFQPLTASEGMRMTATGMVMGTPCYLSPEQARGSRDVDQRSDIYAVGVMLYEAVTGRLPFDAENFNDLLFKIVLETPPAAHEVLPDLDRDFSRIIAKAMARDAGERFQSAAEFADTLAHWSSARGLALTGPVVTSSAKARLPSNHELAIAPSLTPGSWGGTRRSKHPELAEPEFKSRKGLVAALIAGGVLLFGAAGFAIYGAVGSSETAAPTSATPTKEIVPPPKAAEPSPSPVVDLSPPPVTAPEREPETAPFIPDPTTGLAPPTPTKPAARQPVVQQPRPKTQKTAATTATKSKPPAATATTATAKPKRRDFGY